MAERPEFLYDLYITPFPHDDDLIKMLSLLDPLAAIEFYRERLGNTYTKLYKKVTNDATFIKNSLKEFVDYDIFLSPFSSYPVNDPAHILLRRPFERIYNDAFILNQSDFKIFIKRAYLVYSNFAELLSCSINTLILDEIEYLDYKRLDLESYCENRDLDIREDCSGQMEYIKYRINYLHNIKNNLETFVKISIYHWNIAVERFDSICINLEKDMEKYDYKNKYHIFQENENIQIFNLLDDRSIQVPKWLEWYKYDSPLLSESNDFMELLPCSAFYEDNMTTEPIAYETILEKVKHEIR